MARVCTVLRREEPLIVWLLIALIVCSVSSPAFAAAAPPTLSFFSSPSWNGVFLLRWTATGATSCTAANNWTGAKPITGSERVGPFTTGATFKLTCTGAGGSTAKTLTLKVIPAPIVLMTATPTNVAYGGAAQLKWSSTNTTSCTASGSWTGTKSVSGTQSTGALTIRKDYKLTCSGPGGAKRVVATVNVAKSTTPTPTLTLTASPTSVPRNGTSRLTWSSTNATSCNASGSWSGAKATSGNLTTAALTANASYTLVCTGSGGSITRTVAVVVTQTPAPTLTLTASPTSVPRNGTSRLTWSSTNATSCNASGSWSGAKATSGNLTTAALTANASYTLVCTGSGGSITRTVAVAVTQTPAAVTLTANPKSVPASGSTTLTWQGSGVTSCTASGGWSGTRSASGTASVGPITQDTTYSLSCSGGGSTAVAMTTVMIRRAQLSWQAPTKNVDGSNLTNLAGYKVYYGTASRNYTQTISVSGASTLQRTVTLSAPGTWYFAVTAVDTLGNESAKSGEVSKAIP